MYARVECWRTISPVFAGSSTVAASSTATPAGAGAGAEQQSGVAGRPRSGSLLVPLNLASRRLAVVGDVRHAYGRLASAGRADGRTRQIQGLCSDRSSAVVSLVPSSSTYYSQFVREIHVDQPRFVLTTTSIDITQWTVSRATAAVESVVRHYVLIFFNLFLLDADVYGSYANREVCDVASS